jgi:hypothetical protein
MFVLRPKGFWANLETGLPPELRNVRPSRLDQRAIDELTGEFVQRRPNAEALREWLGINLRFVDPADYALWQQDQAEKNLKSDVNAAGRVKRAIVDEAMSEWGAQLGRSRAFVEALYDQALAENKRLARVDLRSFEKKLATGQVDERAALAAGAALAGKDRESVAELVALMLRDVPVEQNREDAKILLRQKLVNALRARALKAARPPTAAELRDLAGTPNAQPRGDVR